MASENIGKLLREARINANISVEEISEALISLGFKAGKNTIYSWENGNSQPTPDALLYMCKRYHIRDILDYFGYKAPNTTLEMILTNPHEQKVITAYRAQPDMQGPVDKLLGIWESKEESEESYKMKYELEKLEKKEAKEGFIQKAAYGGKGVETDTLSTEEIAEIKEMARQMDMDKKGRGNY